jgi:hypothetical protein
VSSRTDRATQRNPVSKNQKKKKKKKRKKKRRRRKKRGFQEFVPVTSAFTSAGTAQQSLVSQSKVKRTRTL